MSDAPPTAVAGLDERGLYRTLFAAYPDALLVVDNAGTIVLGNPAAAELLGYGVDELAGLRVDALVPDSVRPRHAAYRQAFAREPRSRPMGTQMELVAKRKDGSEKMVEIALSPLQGQGMPLTVAAIRDIGAYPRVKQALQRAHYSERLANLGRLAVDARDPQVLLDQVPAVAAEALQADVASVYLLEGSGVELRVASVRGAIAGESLNDRVVNRPDTSIGFVLAKGRSITVHDYTTERRFSVPQAYLDAGFRTGAAVPISDRGRTIGVLAVRSYAIRPFGDDEVRFLESIANLLASNLQRAQSEHALGHAQRLESVGQLTGGIAHDFNNLLTVIQGNLQVLDELPALADEPAARQMVGAATRAARRGAELTGKLLAFSRRQVLQPVAVDVSALLGSLSDMLRRTLDQRIVIGVEVDPGCPPVRADAGQLESALLNVAINARDAMPDGGTLRFNAARAVTLPDDVRAELDDGEAPADAFVSISVVDSGGGMPDEVRRRAFEPFFTTKDVGRGTGLGLSTVYGFAKQSRGAVTLDSELGVGTLFTLFLPSVADAESPAAEGDDASGIPARLRVLLVEDDPEVRDVMVRFLAAFDCRVVAAASAEQALAELADDRFDLLLSDIALGPGMRGSALAERAQAMFPQLGVLLMSGYPAELLDADRDSPPSWGLLRKPCSREELGAAIARVVRAA